MSRGIRTAGGALGAVLSVVLLAGCCITAPPAEKYFDRSTPLETTKLFQYAVETRQYPAAFRCLDPASREKYSETKLKLFLRLGKIEDLDDVVPEEFFKDALRFPLENSELEASVQLEYLETYAIIVILVRHGAEWLIDLERTVGRMVDPA